jgi:hypothetical protein
MIEITVFQKANGPLTRRIELANGKPQSDGSACLMGTGTARRFRFDRLGNLCKSHDPVIVI